MNYILLHKFSLSPFNSATLELHTHNKIYISLPLELAMRPQLLSCSCALHIDWCTVGLGLKARYRECPAEIPTVGTYDVALNYNWSTSHAYRSVE